MQELIHWVESPRQCSYLPDREASLEYRIAFDVGPRELSAFLSRGYRRFGASLFRPACFSCSQCSTVRVLAREFVASRSQRRALRANNQIRIEHSPLSIRREDLSLHDRYHRFMRDHRGWPYHQTTPRSYAETFLAAGERVGSMWRYFQADRLVGVAFMDEAENAVSLVYFFHEPEWRPLGPGTFSILKQIEYAKDRGLDYVYLGYWIGGNPSMDYKRHFHPHEILKQFPLSKAPPHWMREE